MRKVLVAALLTAGLVVVADAWNELAGEPVVNRSIRDYSSGRELITLSSPVDEHRVQLTLIDPQLRVMTVYHIQRDTGEIALKSVRNFHWDQQLVEFNSVNPLPREIQQLIEQQ